MSALRNVVIATATAALAATTVGAATATAATSTVTTAPTMSAPTVSKATAASAKVSKTLATNLSVPWNITFMPNGKALVSQRDTATIVRVTPGGVKKTIGRVPGVVSNGASGGEAGLLGLAVSPHFKTNQWLYAYISTSSDNRVVRMKYHDGAFGKTHVVIKGIPKGLHHNGGGLAFSNYGMLYVSTGEGGVPSRSQKLSSLGGKILRLNPDGSIPRSNPFAKSPVWSYGHRNVEGMAFDKANRLWATEFGDKGYDELNLILKGHDYGWPATQGKTSNPKYTSPKAQWRTSVAGPSGIAIRNGVAWIGAITGQRLYRVPLNGTKAGTPKAYFVGTYGRIRSVHKAPDGSLWVGTSNRDGRATPRSGDDRLLRLAVS